LALEAAFKDVNTQMRSLHEAFVELRLVVVEEQPLLGDHVLAEMYEDVAEDLLGWLTEALAQAGKGQQAARHPANLEVARVCLVDCQERYNNISHRYWSNLLSYERLSELLETGRERGGDWLLWSHAVKERLERCRHPLYSTGQSLFRCWRELTEWC
jgi:hypothetical protein